MDRGSRPHNFIRFGLQRKRTFLTDFQALYDGLIIPANILLYQYKKTPLMVHAVNQKPFVIDPMTYLFGFPSFDLFKRRVKEGAVEFKPSFKRLLEEHGLPPDVQLKGRQDILPYLRSNAKLASFVEKGVGLQKDTTLRNFLKYAAEFVEEETEEDRYRPDFVIAPYFFLPYEPSALKKELLSLTKSILKEARRLGKGSNTAVYPMLFLARDGLLDESGVDLAAEIESMGFAGYCLWIEDFREHTASQEEIRGLTRIIGALSDGGDNYVLNMYGGYFSMILFHFGLGGVAHGTLYSESRGVQDSVRRGAGRPQIRYYVPKLHIFLTLQSAIRITRSDSSLLCDCGACKRVVRGDPNRIARFEEREEFAEFHFMFNRRNEKIMIGKSSLAEIAEELSSTYEQYSSADWASGRGGFRGEQIVDLSYLRTWARALRPRA